MSPKQTEKENSKKTEKERARKLRPPFCFDKSCQLLLSTYEEKSFDEGYSFFCFGKLKKPQVFKEKQALHENTLSYCYYTPLKGMIRFFMCEDDLWGEVWAMIRVMNKLKEIKCGKCGGVVRKRIVNTCLDCCGGG